MLNILASLLFLILGVLSIVASLFNFNWFFTSENVRFFVKLFGRNGTRVFYGVAGVLIIYMAYYVYNMPMS
ncbi:MAG: immunity 17 family protein [Bacteroidales bacterium]|nr:immunity 17 family protein [Bacteroidales bacterium]